MMKRIAGVLMAVSLLLLTGIAQSFVITNPTTEDIVLSMMLQAGAIYLALWYSQKKGFFAEETPWLPWKRLGIVFLGYILLKFVGEAGHFVMAYQGQQVTENTALIRKVNEHLPFWYPWISSVLTAPIIEEIIFRGIFPRIVFQGYERTGLFLSAVVFGMLHGTGTIGEMIIFIGGGLVFSLVYLYNGSLRDSIAVHLLNNVVAVLF